MVEGDDVDVVGSGFLVGTGPDFDVLNEAAVDPLETVGDASNLECVPVVHKVLEQSNALWRGGEPLNQVEQGSLVRRAVFGKSLLLRWNVSYGWDNGS